MQVLNTSTIAAMQRILFSLLGCAFRTALESFEKTINIRGDENLYRGKFVLLLKLEAHLVIKSKKKNIPNKNWNAMLQEMKKTLERNSEN